MTASPFPFFGSSSDVIIVSSLKEEWPIVAGSKGAV
jgi:hypothetical protein